jgi:uroporphyrinogen-III synthase
MSRIAVTRPAGLEEELEARLQALGHEVFSCPLIATEPLGDDPIDASAYDWLVVTSRNGAAEVARRLSRPARRLAAIGPGTAAELERLGLRADLTPAEPSQEALADALGPSPGRVLVAAAAGARRYLVETLGADFVPLYRTHELRPGSFPEVELVVVASPSAARAFAALVRPIPVVSIGPQTSAAALEAGLTLAGEARTSDLDGLVEAIDAAARYGRSVTAEASGPEYGAEPS